MEITAPSVIADASRSIRRIHVLLGIQSLIVVLSVNGVVVGAAIFANLAFERIGFDLYVVALLTVLSLFLVRRYGPRPLIVYYAVGYTFGLAAIAAYKLFF